MSFPTIIAQAVLDKIIALLVPLFLTDGHGDQVTARQAAISLLDDYNTETEEELRLAAEIISFGFGALDFLGQSMAPDLTMNAVLRLRGSANPQHRSANQCQRTLDKLRKERRSAAADPKVKPLAPAPIPTEPLALSNYVQAPLQSASDISMSRQQRRAAERRFEKTQRQERELARREAMRATRISPVSSMLLQQQSPTQHLYHPT